MAARLAFVGGVLTGSLVGAAGLSFLIPSPTRDTLPIHVEYEEKTKQAQTSVDTWKHASEIMKYGVPVSAPYLQLYTSHVLHYNTATKTPSAVYEHFTASSLKGEASRKRSKFKPDPSLPATFSAENSDYWKSGWSRGHMAPAGDCKASQAAMNESFLLSNILPQDLDNNSGAWNRFELYCRDLTKKFEDVRVISGPLWIPTTQKDGKKMLQYQVIGENEVSVPTHLYKVIVAETLGSPPAVGAFILPNEPISSKHKLPEYEVPLLTVEKKSGFQLLPHLDLSKTQDLCEVEGCQMVDAVEFEMFWIRRGIQNAWDVTELERNWTKVKSLTAKPDPELLSLYATKKLQLQRQQ